jgi:hypothetical protein
MLPLELVVDWVVSAYTYECRLARNASLPFRLTALPLDAMTYMRDVTYSPDSAAPVEVVVPSPARWLPSPRSPLAVPPVVVVS